ncbi:hypothetical protein LTR84_011290 [Exophiala bonariae]|uniref:Cupin type-2 domain-containing protein n=1 Tax=Exophiala bonariae TaxID=1690606 RepID=A0AAV9MV11_9EURO|nr:hypothetical protein LTR84_011290 [Exophiala bonariae]
MATETATTTTTAAKATSFDQETPKAAAFYSGLREKNAGPLWTVLDKLVPPKPNPESVPNIWRYSEMRPSLMEAGKLVTAEEAERRVLMLVNPTLEAPYTTESIYAGLQLILPNETAPAHRHVAFALRFIIEGSGGFTAVEGEKMMMERGDVILTPSWTWHDHGNEGNSPVIWLDGLDLPLFRFLPLNFADQYPEKRYPSTLSTNSKSQFPWAPVEKRLKGAEGPYAVYHYVTDDGKALSATLGAQAERVAAGTTSPTVQETGSFVYHVVEGEGYSTILSPGDKSPKDIRWTGKDTFAIPAWSQISHTATSNTDVFLFAINDRPMVTALGLRRQA